ncbi:MAG: aminopeptidase P family protein [Chloroflexi bacterium]|nr:MAG: aminopeptidase P family protein [Chloroflexota bacterium]
MANSLKSTGKTPVLARQEQLGKVLSESGYSALILNPGASLKYMTGLSFHLMERPVVVFFTPRQPPIIVLPELEAGKLKDLNYPIKAFPYGENPASWGNAFKSAAQAADINGTRAAIEPRQLRVLELRYLETASPKAQFVSGEDCIGALRMIKHSSEIETMRSAVEIAQEALKATMPIIKVGVTEREIAAELTAQLLRAGSEPEMAFAPIVSGGPNSANPHAVPSARALQEGDLLVIDWGAVYHGYISDITRTFAIHKVENEFQQITQIVAEANAVGRAIARPGILAGEVDRATRTVITQAGYGDYFIHRTGHGIGMEGHEEPYIFAENSLSLAPGMTFTIEPGIYLPGRGGVRIEDNVVITKDGADCLTDLPRELIQLG